MERGGKRIGKLTFFRDWRGNIRGDMDCGRLRVDGSSRVVGVLGRADVVPAVGELGLVDSKVSAPDVERVTVSLSPREFSVRLSWNPAPDPEGMALRNSLLGWIDLGFDRCT